eukprot:CAMPEP_0119133238 /NCGR_PEP_ID=MMETSP1310-20130426/13272_1 /TAXON_ID=464262 /ORGANISM="Genus nov. species nov., Strain RCC2339" /LENGTH=361 /DNA_ID=CAMNT_0007123925 /DNA_START=128 /DNA_END=1213 /DNA_ORIENTATION=-
MAPLMQPFWRTAVMWLPEWMAPNLVTLLGFISMVCASAVVSFYSLDFSTPAPAWVYFFVSGALFFYQTMDALDGKQARRTGCSSPLGELFDHGCDAMMTVLIAVISCQVFQVGQSWPIVYLCVASPMLPFFATQWEEYHLNKFILGRLGVTEAQLILVVSYLTVGVMGPEFPKQLVLPAAVPVLGAMSLGELLAMVGIGGSLVTLADKLYTVAKIYRREPAKLLGAYAQLLPLCLVVASMWSWSAHASIALSPADSAYTHMYCIGTGLAGAFLSGTAVVFRVLSQRLPVFQPAILPFCVPLLLPLVPISPSLERAYCVLTLILGLSLYLLEARRISLAFCRIFKINVFTIPPGGYPFNKKK